MKVTRRSPAKINWNLRVLGRRPDGYHEIESLVSPVGLFDDLTFCSRSEPGIELSCETPGVPVDDRNLIVKAAQALTVGNTGLGVVCRLQKRIPMGGGLGGGSSNAAAALTGLNELWQLNLPGVELSSLAARIGSDVPFFLLGGSGILRGRGERLEAVEVDFGGYLVLLMPGYPVSTAAVYAVCQPEPRDRRPIEPASGLDARGWMERAFNMLEPAARAVCPALVPLMDEAALLAGRPVRISGSGSTLFTAFDTCEEAERFAGQAGSLLKLETRVVRIVR